MTRTTAIESEALTLLRYLERTVLVSVCMTCRLPYRARIVAACDRMAIALSHGICDKCDAARELREVNL